MISRTVSLAAALVVGWLGASSAQNRAIRFAAMDRNNDGRIARAEWRGSDQSFRVHDWNGDGVLSGDEVRVGARRADRQADREFDSYYRDYEYDDWSTKGFTALDHNKDLRITSDEWHFNRETFRRVDHNNDGALSRAEFLSEDDTDDDRDDRFDSLDVDRNNRIDRDEWHGSSAAFEAFDDNRDGLLSRQELSGKDSPTDLFTSLDVNRDRVISRNEWHWSLGNFDTRDANRDGRLTRAELEGPANSIQTQNQAYRSGYARGTTDGRQAGREDRQNNWGWDLEGQRELEGADAGYSPAIGNRADYQAGYREAFRKAYAEGFRSS